MAEPKPKEMLQAAEENKDGWENVITGLGTSRDKRVGSQVIPPRYNTNYTENQNLYFSSDMARTAVELIASEMVRQWISIVANDPKTVDDKSRKEESESTTEERISIGNLMLNKLEELDAKSKYFEAEVWAQVFGGSLLFIGADDQGGDDPRAMMQPLDEDRIESIKFLAVFDRWDVHIDSYYTDPSAEKFGQPQYYRLNETTFNGVSTGINALIHESRFIRFDGVLTNRRRMKENGGWADPVFTRTRDLIRDYDVAWHSVANILQDFAQAIFKMKGLKDAILSDKDDLVLRRMAQIDLCRGVSRAVPLDADGEDFDRKPTPLAGLPDLMDRFAYRMSAAFRAPATLLFGQSPSGMQSTGAADIRFFYDQISAKQESSLRPKIERLIKLCFKAKDGPTGGVEPEEWSFYFNPLYRLTELEQADLRNKQANSDKIYIEMGVVSEDEIAYSRFGGDKYSPETILDLERRQEDKLADEIEPETDPVINPPPLTEEPPDDTEGETGDNG